LYPRYARLGDLARVPDERGDRFLVRVIALGRGLDDQAGKVDATLLEDGHDVEARVGQHDRGPVRSLAKPPNRRLDLLRR